MSEGYGAQGMVGRLRRVVMRRPGQEMAVADPTHGTTPVPLTSTRRGEPTMPSPTRCAPGTSRCSITMSRCPSTRRQRVRLRPGPCHRPGDAGAQHGQGAPARGGRTARAHAAAIAACPVFGRLEGDARAEGGDTLWLDHDTLAVGRGFRTNVEGVRQLRVSSSPLGVAVVDFDLPYFTGPEACLHLLSLISPVDVDLAVAYPPLMPTAFWAELQRRGIRLLEVPEEEFAHTQATNVLAVGPAGASCSRAAR